MASYEAQKPYYTLEAETPLCAFLVSYLISGGKVELYSGEYSIPKLTTPVAMNDYLAREYGGVTLDELFFNYYRLQPDAFRACLSSFQPGVIEDTELFQEEHPELDITSDEVKKQRVFENHGSCLYAFCSYIMLKNGFVGRKFILC